MAQLEGSAISSYSLPPPPRSVCQCPPVPPPQRRGRISCQEMEGRRRIKSSDFLSPPSPPPRHQLIINFGVSFLASSSGSSIVGEEGEVGLSYL